MPPPQDRNISASFAKGLAVLEAFDGDAARMTLAELARRTGQDRATARRGAMTLLAAGYLRQEGRDFVLTHKVLGLAGGFLQANQFGRLVQPVLNHHAGQMQTEITLAVRDNNRVMLLAQSTLVHGPVSYGFTAGSSLPLLHTSLGRMLLAAVEPDEAEQILRHSPCVRHTAQSLSHLPDILAEVDRARDTGLSITNGEFEPGITGFATLVGGPGAKALVVGSSAPEAGLSKTRSAQICASLQQCAADLRQAGVLSAI